MKVTKNNEYVLKEQYLRSIMKTKYCFQYIK